jgi:hypothetical protein
VNRNTTGGGQATFNNLNIDSAGTKRLLVSSAGLAPDTSAFFTISPGPATRLAYLQQPGNGPAGSAISPPVVLQLRDAIGNDVPHAGDSVFISLSSGTGTLTGTTRQATNSDGNVSFSDLIINQGGVKTLTASGPGLTPLQSASFTLSTFTITATAGPNGTISPSGSVTVFPGADLSLTISPNTGYHVDSVIVDGASVGPVSGYTFTNVTANHTIRTVFAINQFTITATTGPNGAISPSGSVNANFGATQAFTITPNTGYHIDSVIVDGANQGAIASYTFSNVTANHTIRAVFAIDQFTITSTAGANGVISPEGPTVVDYGESQSYSIIPNTGYHIDSLIVDDVNQGQLASFTFTNVTANHTIRALFAINAFTITATAGPNGAISPSGSVNANFGGTQAFTITPNTGYHVDSLIVDGTNQGSLTTYTFTNITANHTILALFAPNAILVTVQTVPGGMQINVDNDPYTSPHTFSWIGSQSHSISVADIIAGGAGRQFAWSSWSDSGTRSHFVTPLVNTTYTAAYTTQFFLTMNANTGVSVTPTSGWRDSASVVPIEATAAARYDFNSGRHRQRLQQLHR